MALNYSELPESEDSQVSKKVQNLRGKFLKCKPFLFIISQALSFTFGEPVTIFSLLYQVVLILYFMRLYQLLLLKVMCKLI